MQNKIKKVVIIGGGNGSGTTACALKKFIDKIDLSAVISTTDSTGSSGMLRKEFKTLPTGDLLRAILGMSKYDYQLLKQVFYRYRFSGVGKLDKHNLGNLFLVLGEKYDGNLINSIRALEQAVGAVGRVYPVTLARADIVGELSNGKIVREEGNLDRPKYNKKLRIKKLFIEPEVKVFFGAKKVIETADCIVMGPGSLYTSIVATLLPKGVYQAIKKSRAKLVYVCGNAYEAEGETGPAKLSEFIAELESYLPRKLDRVIFNHSKLNNKQRKHYKDKKWNLIEFDEANLSDHNVVGGDFEKEAGGLAPDKLAVILKKVV